jgi:hypothetical protein
MEDFKKLQQLLSSLEADALKANAGNKAAGTRLRVGLSKMKKLAQAIRVATKGEK